MAIPGFQEFMLPFLRIAADGKEHSTPEAAPILADQLKINEAERELMQPSGYTTTLNNRVAWAITHLLKARLLERPSRGRFIISERGQEILKCNPPRIDVKFLLQFPEYQSFTAKKAVTSTGVGGIKDEDTTAVSIKTTPDEQLELACKELRETLADDLLQRVRAATPKFFERLVIDLLVNMGYGGSHADAAQVVGKSGDRGIDGVIKEDRLGLDMVYVQAKRHENDIGPGPIREFVGSLGEHKANKGVFITSGAFTSGARDAAARAHTRIVLIDGEQLADLMITFGIGVSNVKTYTVQRLDNDYFDEV